MAKSNVLGASNLAAGPGEVGYMPPPDSPELAAYQAASNELYYAEQAAAAVPVAAAEAAPEPEAPAEVPGPEPEPVKAAKGAPSLAGAKKAAAADE